jgi:hypothetical protein
LHRSESTQNDCAPLRINPEQHCTAQNQLRTVSPLMESPQNCVTPEQQRTIQNPLLTQPENHHGHAIALTHLASPQNTSLSSNRCGRPRIAAQRTHRTPRSTIVQREHCKRAGNKHQRPHQREHTAQAHGEDSYSSPTAGKRPFLPWMSPRNSPVIGCTYRRKKTKHTHTHQHRYTKTRTNI